MTDHIKGLIDNSPNLMSQLTQKFAENKNFADRNKIRRQIKALLDLLSVDTQYPAVAPEKKPQQQFGGGLMGAPLYGGHVDADFGPGPDRGVLAIPGAQPERDNEEILRGAERQNANEPAIPQQGG